jgi:hypothetical protein
MVGQAWAIGITDSFGVPSQARTPRGGSNLFLILSLMAFAFIALVLYKPNRGSLKWAFSTHESTPFIFPAAVVEVGDVRPLTDEPAWCPLLIGECSLWFLGGRV